MNSAKSITVPDESVGNPNVSRNAHHSGMTPVDFLIEKWHDLFVFGESHYLYRASDKVLRGFYRCAGVVVTVTLPLGEAWNDTYPPKNYTVRVVGMETVRLEWADLVGEGYTHYTENTAQELLYADGSSARSLCENLAIHFRRNWLWQKASDTLQRGVLTTTNPVKDFQSEAY